MSLFRVISFLLLELCPQAVLSLTTQWSLHEASLSKPYGAISRMHQRNSYKAPVLIISMEFTSIIPESCLMGELF